MYLEHVESCSSCGRPWTENPVTQEWTCFVHGRPDGSEIERQVWARRLIAKRKRDNA